MHDFKLHFDLLCMLDKTCFERASVCKTLPKVRHQTADTDLKVPSEVTQSKQRSSVSSLEVGQYIALNALLAARKEKICNEMFSIILKYTIGHSCRRKPVLLCEMSGNYPPLPPPSAPYSFFFRSDASHSHHHTCFFFRQVMLNVLGCRLTY